MSVEETQEPVDPGTLFVRRRNRDGISSDPKPAAFIAEYVAPSTAKRFAPIRRARIGYGAGTGNDDDTRFTAQCTRMRDRCIVHEHHARRRQIRRDAVHRPFVSAYPCNDRFEARVTRQTCIVHRIAERRL